MFRIIATLSAMALCLLLGTFISRKKQRFKHKLQRRWLRCAVCGCYQNTIYDYCFNHDLPAYLLLVSERQQRRINYHLGNIWTHPQVKRQQDRFIAFTMCLEDMTDDDWSTNAAILVYEQIGSRYIHKFVEFLLGMEESIGKRLNINDVVEQFLVSEEMESDENKVAQN